MGRQRRRAKDKLFWWVLQPWNKYNHPRGLCDSVWHFGYFFHATRCNQFSWGWWGKHTRFYCILMSTKKRCILFCFLLGVYGTSCNTKHEQNFHLPFTITEIRVWGCRGRWICLGAAGAARAAPSSPLQREENLQARGERKGKLCNLIRIHFNMHEGTNMANNILRYCRAEILCLPRNDMLKALGIYEADDFYSFIWSILQYLPRRLEWLSCQISCGGLGQMGELQQVSWCPKGSGVVLRQVALTLQTHPTPRVSVQLTAFGCRLSWAYKPSTPVQTCGEMFLRIVKQLLHSTQRLMLFCGRWKILIFTLCKIFWTLKTSCSGRLLLN